MADVATKAVSANDIKNGSAICGVDKNGNIETLAPENNKAIGVDSLETLYTTRFDDVSYYTS